ncbi:hypothetical protein H4R33_002515 [Dimargaris cristalligena]|nr:hypothetical protein H4R33_002515 [Dimargaris cristalligena]
MTSRPMSTISYTQPLKNPETVKKLDKILDKYNALKKKLENPELSTENKIAIQKDMAKIEKTTTAYEDIIKARQEQSEIMALMEESRKEAGAQDTIAMCEEELAQLEDTLSELEQRLFQTLLPKDISEMGSAILEVRPGTGGDEAALFADEIFRMYQRFAAASPDLRFEPVSITRETSSSGAGGGGGGHQYQLKEGIATITGEGVFRQLMFESGVHRVQRVPATESAGRIHTSTVKVAVLAQPSEVQIDVRDADIRVDLYRASGAGGQHVNTTDSAVRLTHLPTGIVVAIQDERSQHKNRAKAMKVLRARIYEMEKAKVDKERRDYRSKLIGRGERSEKIRTYNFPKNRVTDHRINLTMYNLDKVMEGTAALQEFIENLQMQHYMDLLSHMDDQIST